ncbi:MAG TPA: hypothetical protein VHM23_13350 [Actinomycetota bacterium]|nr:hypothetical protein [Actinomycetota bacterium]
MTGLLIATIAAGGALLLGLVKADLEDAAVCRWLARKLVYRAALRLPRGERARWRDESLQNVLDLPGRLPPLLWALDIYVKSGRWGRMRGALSRWQVLLARVRAAWQRLRTLPQARARALSKQPGWAFDLNRAARQALQVEAESAHGAAVALDAVVAVNTWIANPRPPRDGKMHLSHQEFIAWLAQERQDFEDKIDRRPRGL